MARVWREGDFGLWLEVDGAVYKFDGATWHSVNYMGEPLAGPSVWAKSPRGKAKLTELGHYDAMKVLAKVRSLEALGRVWDEYAHEHGHLRQLDKEPTND